MWNPTATNFPNHRRLENAHVYPPLDVKCDKLTCHGVCPKDTSVSVNDVLDEMYK